MADKLVKDPTKFLSDEVRENLINTLNENNIETEGLSDADILLKLQNDYSETKKAKDDLLSASSEKHMLAEQLNSYLNTPESRINDKPFAARLFDMGIPPIFLKIFRDHDSTLSDERIWEMVRFSGINTSDTNLQEIVSRRRKIPQSAKNLLQGREW